MVSKEVDRGQDQKEGTTAEGDGDQVSGRTILAPRWARAGKESKTSA